jgi:probable rRNA maturation factor
MDNDSEPPSSLLIDIDDPAWHALVPDLERTCRRAVAAALAEAPLSGEVSLLLTGDARLRELNRAYRGIDRPTNVLSFPALPPRARPAPGGPAMLGDIAIARETLAREAAATGITPADHLAHLLVHGVLHLLGHDHEDEHQASVMEVIERRVLAGLGIADPYAEAVR